MAYENGKINRKYDMGMCCCCCQTVWMNTVYFSYALCTR